MAHKLTTCTFCGVGCGLYLESPDNRTVVGVYPSMSHPTNAGKICVRGWNAHEVATSPDRLKNPLLRKNGRFEEVSWDEAIGFIAMIIVCLGVFIGFKAAWTANCAVSPSRICWTPPKRSA